jgi:hypothetical protein
MSQSISTIFFDTSGNKDETIQGEYNQTYYSTAEDDEYYIEYVEAEQYKETFEHEDKSDPYAARYYLSVILGAVLLTFQAVDLAFIVIPTAWLGMNRFVKNLVTPSGFKAEAAQKKAASFKVSKMIDNALALHSNGPSFSSLKKSSSELSKSRGSLCSSLQAIARFQLQESETETAGGVFWAWKKIFNGSIFAEEGIWFHSRLLACNLALLLVASITIFLAYVGYVNSDEFLYSESPTVAQQAQILYNDLLNNTLECIDKEFFSDRYPMPPWTASSLFSFLNSEYLSEDYSLFARKVENLTVKVIDRCWDTVRQRRQVS